MTEAGVQRHALLVDRHRAEICHSVRSVELITHRLHAQSLLNDEDVRAVLSASASQAGMDELYKSLERGGATVKSAFYRLLLQLEPALMRDLELAEFVDKYSNEIIQWVKKVQQIADRLRSQGTISDVERRRILVTGTSEEGMSELYRSLKRGGAAAKSAFYWLLQEFKPALIVELQQAQFVDEHHQEIAERVRDRPSLVAGLHTHGVAEDQEHDELRGSVDELYRRLEKAGSSSKSAFYRLLQQHEPQLIADLERKTLLQKYGTEIWLRAEVLEHDVRQEERTRTEETHSDVQQQGEEEPGERGPQGSGSSSKRQSTKMDSPLKVSMIDSAQLVRRRNSMDSFSPNLSGESTGAQLPASPGVSELRLMLLGNNIEEKIAVRSTLLSQKEWGSGDNTPAGQSESEEGQRLLVVNTADWFSEGLSQGEVRQDVSHCVHLCAPGPHVFLLVTPLDKPCQGLREVLENMELLLGDGCLEHTIMLFTCCEGSRYHQSIQRENQELHWVLDRCGNRYHVLNLEHQGNETKLKELMEKLQDMVAANGGRFYSSKVYQEAEAQLTEVSRKMRRDREAVRFREQAELNRYEQELHNSLRTMWSVIQEQEIKIGSLQERIAELERQLKEERSIEKKEELRRELNREVAHRQKAEKELQKLKDAMEREKSDIEQRHQQQMEDIRWMQERTVSEEAERLFTKVLLPELQSQLLTARIKIERKHRSQLEEKEQEVQRLREELQQLYRERTVLEEIRENYEERLWQQADKKLSSRAMLDKRL